MQSADLEAIDDAIAALYETRREVEAEIQAACDHVWDDDCLFTGAKLCRKCRLYDHTNACTVIEWPSELRDKWTYDVPPERFCFKHKRALKECQLVLR